jgi:hypothetical protein
MDGKATAPARQKEMGEQNEIPVEQLCGVDSCTERRVTSFADEILCCDHFLGRCYTFLEKIDPQRDLASNNSLEHVKLKKGIERCAQRALEVALGTPNLSNMQRARLLDILLWTSDLSANHQPQESEKGNFFNRRLLTKASHMGTPEKKLSGEAASYRTYLFW